MIAKLRQLLRGTTPHAEAATRINDDFDYGPFDAHPPEPPPSWAKPNRCTCGAVLTGVRCTSCWRWAS